MLTKYATIVSLPTKLKSAKPDVEKKGPLGEKGKGKKFAGGGGWLQLLQGKNRNLPILKYKHKCKILVSKHAGKVWKPGKGM